MTLESDYVDSVASQWIDSCQERSIHLRMNGSKLLGEFSQQFTAFYYRFALFEG